MKKILYRLLNASVGKFIRQLQKMLPIRTDKRFSLHDVVHNKSIEDTANYVLSECTEAMIFSQRPDLWRYCVERATILSHSREPWILEFGVWKGESINFFASAVPNSKLFGFDSFEGLEEDWYGFELAKGTFNLGGKLPKVEKNVVLKKGWFEDTLPNFKKELGSQRVAILHLDADTYKPTAFVLTELVTNIGAGTIVIFDEYFGYPNWRLHEYKAWQEFVKANQIKYRYIAYSAMQCAVEII